jgi:hypothetical protein
MHPLEKKARDEAEKSYYDRAEKALKSMNKYGYPGEKGNINNTDDDSCWGIMVQFAMLALTFGSLLFQALNN